jgi:hypothetical protein
MRYILAAMAAAVLAAGCTIPAEKASAPPPVAGEETQSSGTESADESDPGIAKIGEWMEADDGVRFRVSKLGRGRVGQYAAGGRPGGAAAVVTVQVRNEGQARFDLSLLNVVARLGADGQQAEQVIDVDRGFGGVPEGTLSKGRTSTIRYMFAAERAGDLRTVAVDVTPGIEYETATWEGGV